jgi:hypothetical protein
MDWEKAKRVLQIVVLLLVALFIASLEFVFLSRAMDLLLDIRGALTDVQSVLSMIEGLPSGLSIGFSLNFAFGIVCLVVLVANDAFIVFREMFERLLIALGVADVRRSTTREVDFWKQVVAIAGYSLSCFLVLSLILGRD